MRVAPARWSNRSGRGDGAPLPLSRFRNRHLSRMRKRVEVGLRGRLPMPQVPEIRAFPRIRSNCRPSKKRDRAPLIRAPLIRKLPADHDPHVSPGFDGFTVSVSVSGDLRFALSGRGPLPILRPPRDRFSAPPRAVGVGRWPLARPPTLPRTDGRKKSEGARTIVQAVAYHGRVAPARGELRPKN